MHGSDRNKRYALIALVASLIAIVLVAYFSQPPSDSVADEYASEIEQHAKQDVPRSVASADDFKFWEDTFPQWAMAFFSIVATGISWLAVVYLKETLKETSRAVKAAEDAVHVTQDLGQKQIRAYISIPRVELPEHMDDRRFLAVRVTIQNAGQSPAIDVHGEHCVVVLGANTQSGLLPRPEPMSRPSKFVLGAGGTSYSVTHSGPSSGPMEDVYNALADGKCEFYAWGWVKYRDVFGEEHETTYQWLMSRESLRAGIGFRTDEFGNTST